MITKGRQSVGGPYINRKVDCIDVGEVRCAFNNLW